MSKNRLAATDTGAFPHATLPAQVAAVIEAIETDIIRGRILPRNRLIEDHLMEDYDAKRHVVRAALAELQRLGVVVKPPHLGARIRRFDDQSLRDLYHFRAVLHGAAVAAMPLPVALERMAAVEAAAQAHAEAAATGDLITIHRTNMAFHRLFYGLCDNPYIAESIRLHDWLSFPARAYGIADARALEQACGEHAAMVRALHACDRARLHQLALDHMDRARQLYVEKFLMR
ncbi:GntR family transcriptional regulator [Paenacidovorax monticola]|uniref:GntR family transcriptional regulator n=1 Tax=Paenacidovorax monticola TaxID=1926868 RepID=A0A7H0HCP6_9BURK|nr:GntR family transcriptional regulator [Paenacidovorax monticola]QNP58312.1 GntR family transcriptional regulator [Paenacidovorax monticola]